MCVCFVCVHVCMCTCMQFVCAPNCSFVCVCLCVFMCMCVFLGMYDRERQKINKEIVPAYNICQSVWFLEILMNFDSSGNKLMTGTSHRFYNVTMYLQHEGYKSKHHKPLIYLMPLQKFTWKTAKTNICRKKEMEK